MQNPSIYLYGPGDAKLEKSSLPECQDPHDVILRIAYVGVCGSDVHFWSHGGITTMITAGNPLIMGHEASGTVHKIGSSVNSLGIGDKVAIEPGFPCRRCKTCKAGRYNLCPSIKFAACPPDSHGTLTKYFRIPEDFCYKLPEWMKLDEGVLVEPLAVAVHVTRLADVRVGQDVVVFGAGTVGLLCAAVARAIGARKVVSVDINAERLEFAKKFAATGSYLPVREDSAEETAGKIIVANGLDDGADAVLEATGVGVCIEAGIHTAKPGGTFIQAGLGKRKVEFPIVKFSEKEITMKGCFRYNAGDYDLALHLLESQQVSVRELITGCFNFEQATEAWESTKRGDGIKNLIRGPED